MSWKRTDISPAISGYGPADLQGAYGVSAAALTNGAAQTVAVVDAFDYPQAEADLGVYRSNFALPACTTANGCFLRVNQSGLASAYPATDPTGGWESEEALDLDMVSAICPNCELILVEANSTSNTDFYAAEDTAATTCAATVISNSWDGSEYAGEIADEIHFNHPGVQITFASGDSGYNSGMDGYPLSSKYVTAVGGTTLSGNFPGPWAETTWAGSGSQCSTMIPQPAYQTALGVSYTSLCSMRIDNDVAANAGAGVAVRNTFGGTGGTACTGWCAFIGTSVATPIIAGVYGLAGNGATIGYGYAYTHGPFHDITTGSNGSCGGSYLCTAKPGYDGPTGNGTPNGTGGF